MEDPERCYEAAKSKDARFDGWFFCAVTSTGIYCRPSCPARTPKRENMRFYATAAAAQQAGFRACLRCRPDATPGSPEWNNRADVVARAMRLIRDGIVDREGVEGLSLRLGYSTRQLNRLITDEVGSGPLALARAQRCQTARVLLETTELPVAHIAFAAGFASVRQCNDTIRQVFADTPSGLRARAARSGAARGTPPPAAAQGIRLRLPCRQPFNPASVLDFLGQRALPGVESLVGASYTRGLRLPHGHGVVTLRASGTDAPGPCYVEGVLRLSDLRDLTTAVSRCRQLLDLDADPIAVWEALRIDRLLGPVVDQDPDAACRERPTASNSPCAPSSGNRSRSPGARTVAGRLVQAAGEALPDPVDGVTHLFPTPLALAELGRRDPGAFSMPANRRRALVLLAEAVDSGALTIDAGSDPVEVRRSLVALPGIGPWTAEYVAMRALRDPDAFMPTDLGIRRAAAAVGLPADPVSSQQPRSTGVPGAATPWPTCGRSRPPPPRTSPLEERKDEQHDERNRNDALREPGRTTGARVRR